MMLALTPIVEQLRGAGYRNVAGLLEFAVQRETPRALPALFVVPTSDGARPNELATGGHSQKLTAGWSVFLVLDSARRDRDAIAEDLQRECTTIVTALAGWAHPGGTGPTDYDGGRLASADAGTIVWQLRFSSPYRFRKAS